MHNALLAKQVYLCPFGHPLGLNLRLWCSGPPTLPIFYAKQLKSLVKFQALQIQAEQLHSADQAAIVIEGAVGLLLTAAPTITIAA